MSLDRRAGLYRRAVGFRRLLIAFRLDNGGRRFRPLTLLEQVPELLVETLLTPPLAAHPPLVTHLHHLRGGRVFTG
jgi:hypothetical protein